MSLLEFLFFPKYQRLMTLSWRQYINNTLSLKSFNNKPIRRGRQWDQPWSRCGHNAHTGVCSLEIYSTPVVYFRVLSCSRRAKHQPLYIDNKFIPHSELENDNNRILSHLPRHEARSRILDAYFHSQSESVWHSRLFALASVSCSCS